MIRPLSPASSRGKQVLKTALFVGGSVLVVALFLFTQTAVRRLTLEVSTTSELLAQVAAQATLPSVSNPPLRDLLSGMQSGFSFPIIITDTTGTPRAWSRVGVEGDLGLKLGLTNDWAYNVIKQVGNYAEVYERNLGEGQQLTAKHALENIPVPPRRKRLSKKRLGLN